MTLVTSMSEPSKIDRCESCGGVGILCSSSHVGCVAATFEVQSAVNVAYVAGVKDEQDRILALIATLHRQAGDWVHSDTYREVLSRLRGLIQKATKG